MNLYNKHSILLLLLFLLSICSCKKVVKGYLSEDIYYQVNPYTAQIGETSYSSSLVYNGSSSPLYVTLIAVHDSAGNDVTSDFIHPDTIAVYKSAVTNTDTTLALLYSKFSDSLVAPFSVNSIGGRLQFTAATKYLNAGTYYIDIQVKNSRGSYIIKNACTIYLSPLSTYYDVNYKRVRTMTDSNTNADMSLTDIDVDVNYKASASTSEIVYRWKDKNGAFFKPSAGEVSRWISSYPDMTNWDPYYTPVYTDSSIIYQIPNIGQAFPFYNVASVSGSSWDEGGYALVYYLIPSKATSNNRKVQTCTSIKFYTSGIYTVTIKLNNVTHK